MNPVAPDGVNACDGDEVTGHMVTATIQRALERAQFATWTTHGIKAPGRVLFPPMHFKKDCGGAAAVSHAPASAWYSSSAFFDSGMMNRGPRSQASGFPRQADRTAMNCIGVAGPGSRGHSCPGQERKSSA
jgi:hypothetical protein